MSPPSSAVEAAAIQTLELRLHADHCSAEPEKSIPISRDVCTVLSLVSKNTAHRHGNGDCTLGASLRRQSGAGNEKDVSTSSGRDESSGSYPTFR